MKNINKILVLSFLVIASLGMTSCEDTSGIKYRITGKVDRAYRLDSVYLYMDNFGGVGKIINRAPVTGGKFTLEGRTDKVQKVFVGNERKQFGVQVVLEESEDIQLEATKEFTFVRGGKINQLLYSLYSDQKSIDLMKEAQKIEVKLTSMDVGEDNGDIFQKLNEQKDSLTQVMYKMEDDSYYKIISDNTSPTLAKVVAMSAHYDYEQLSISERYELLDKYEKELGKHNNIDVYRTFLKQEESKVVSSSTADMKYLPISGEDVTGKQVGIDKYVKSNKYTLLEFWASWCMPCRAEMPNMKKVYEKFKGKGFEIYAFSLDESKEEWKQALKEEQTGWVNVFLTLGSKSEKIVNDEYRVEVLPTSFLINEKGEIIAANDELRGGGLERKLEKLLK